MALSFLSDCDNREGHVCCFLVALGRSQWTDDRQGCLKRLRSHLLQRLLAVEEVGPIPADRLASFEFCYESLRVNLLAVLDLAVFELVEAVEHEFLHLDVLDHGHL